MPPPIPTRDFKVRLSPRSLPSEGCPHGHPTRAEPLEPLAQGGLRDLQDASCFPSRVHT